MQVYVCSKQLQGLARPVQLLYRLLLLLRAQANGKLLVIRSSGFACPVALVATADIDCKADHFINTCVFPES